LNDQAKIQRTLRLLILLAGKRWYNAETIYSRLDISKRTLYRYLSSIESAGFVMERHTLQGYRLQAEGGSMLTLNRLLHFTEEEAHILYKTLSLLQGEGAAKERLIRKLHTLYDCHFLAQAANQHLLEKVATLQKAMERKVQCTLLQYRSNHSQTIEDRLVEPFAFTENYEAIWAYEPANQSCRQFKLERMEGIRTENRNWVHDAKHQIPFTDVFGFAAPKPKGTAKLLLSMRAANLLREEFPLAEKMIHLTDGEYHATLPYADPKGIGRFIRGLPGDVQVKSPLALLKYLNE
jgi:predicted DNA-binding transcriptional regulator YafY